jgi:hypothetical protein
MIRKEQNAPSTEICVFQDRLGSATAGRYRGNEGSARQNCKTIAGEIRAAIEEAQRGHGADSATRQLRDQLAKTLEAWGDCELYGGAASNGKVDLAQAADNYAEARKTAGDPAGAIALGYKLAIVHSLRGTSTPNGGPPVSESPPGITVERGELAQLGAGRQRAVLLRQLAEATASIHGPAPADGGKMLRAFLDQFKLSRSARGPDRREVVEMQLFAAELLLRFDLEADPKTARRDLKYLDSLLAVFQGRREVRPYLRRYYELAVEAYYTAEPAKIDLVQVAHYVLDSRLDQSHSAPGSPMARVVFSFTPKANFAVFLPQDGRPGKRFELGLTRNQIKAAKGQSPHLSDELVSLIKGEIAAGRPIEIFWDDTAAWPDADSDALSDRDWPFGGQLDLAKLRAQVTNQKSGKE